MVSLCFHHLPGAAEERTHHLVDLACNAALVAAAEEEAEVVGIASAHLHTWHWHTRGEEEVLKEHTHRLSGGYKTFLSAEEPVVVVVVHCIRNLASTAEEVHRMVMASACCRAMALLEIGCLVVQVSMLGSLHWTVASPVAAEASSAGTVETTEFALSLGEMEQEVGA